MGGDGLVGRRRELADLEQRLVDARAGHGGVVLVEGVAGVGKTALAHSVAGRARDLGMATAWGACLEGEGASPYRPRLQVLGQLELPPTQLAGPDAADAASRFQLFGEIVESLRAAKQVTRACSPSSTTCTGRTSRRSSCSSSWPQKSPTIGCC